MREKSHDCPDSFCHQRNVKDETAVGYQQATVYFYTGTGNSYRVAVWMADAVRRAGADVKLRSLRSARPVEEIGLGPRAFLGLVMPTHGFTTPWAMLRFALRLPRRRGTQAIAVATRAGAKIGSTYTPGVEGTATFLVALILGFKGYNIRGAIGIDMPSNWISLHPGLSPSTVSGIVSRARRRVASFMEAILTGRRRFVGWVSLAFGLLVSWLSLAYVLVGRFFLTKLFFASESCTGCGLCAERCPNQAIRMRGKRNSRPYWTFHCESCMRCMGFCPTRAVEASHLLAVGVYVLAVIVARLPLLTWLSTRVPILGPLDSVPLWLLESVYALAAIGLLYPLFHLVLRVPGINRFFSRATLTHYYRRYHEPETKFKDLEG